MTIERLKKFKEVRRSVFIIESRLKDCILQSRVPDGLPKGNQRTKPTEESAIRLAALRKRYNARLTELRKEEQAILDWVFSLDDYTVQNYVIMKYIECRSNAEIEETMFYHRSTLERKLAEVLKGEKK